MTISLRDDWSQLTTAGKALTIISISVTAASIFASELVAEAIIWAGFVAAESTMVVTLPIVGAVLVEIGVVIMIFMSIFEMREESPEPALTPIESLIEGVGRSLIATWDEHPGPFLVYTIPTGVGLGGATKTLVLEAANPTSSIMKPRAMSFRFLAGAATATIAPDALFSDAKFELVDATDISRNNPGNIFFGHDPGLEALLQFDPRDSGGAAWEVRVTGKTGGTDKAEQGLIRLAPGYAISVIVSGYLCQGT
ncbi:uncharacterized protein LY79DRAFT_347595 [Colletotrichum navitas]|uniref:Uncharacterized protein n=1 Tax=Colletotrichum navitas TaxID=681940 RepID=A0AAD8PRD2_9PEZI|nr:uncharacterized protein LY79DRAFT_347595 [Colletotrichum navitas]KAK1579235.1 hypothetical protein LY79DRAFT_347595 [Colletotrichum navitas]